jgi:hypothetical protein
MSNKQKEDVAINQQIEELRDRMRALRELLLLAWLVPVLMESDMMVVVVVVVVLL